MKKSGGEDKKQTGGTLYRYVSNEGAAAILKYKYSARDNSLLYNYVISPLAQIIVDTCFPAWLAPNTITVFGLALVASSHVLMLWYTPDLDQAVPSWLYAWCGLSLLIYQVLDVTDGKQARKTGNASPLGLLFDHGCDALNCVLSSLTMASTLLMGPTYMSVGLLLSSSTVFFMATWEEYYTGTLELPIVNGPNEGLAAMISIYLWTACYGPHFWAKPCLFFPSLNNNMVFLLCTATGTVLTIFLNVFNVLKAIKKGKHKSTVLRVTLGIAPYLAVVALSLLWVFMSRVHIINTHPRLVIWTSGLLFCKLVMHTMLSHLCDEPVQLLRKTLIVTFSVAFLTVTGLVPFMNEDTAAYVFFVIALSAYVHMVYYTVQDLTRILGIHCFTVKKTKAN